MISHDEVLQRMRVANPAPTCDPDELVAVMSVIAEKRDAASSAMERPAAVSIRRTASSAGYRRRSWLPVGIVAGAAALVLLAVGLPMLMLGGDESIVVVEPSTTLAPIVTSVPSSTVPPGATSVPIAPATPMTWGRISDPAVFGGDFAQRMVDVAEGNGMVVAVGSDRSGGDMDAAVWYSLDGRAWTRVPHDEVVFGGGGYQQINGVTAVGSGFVAVGTEGDDPYPLPPTYWGVVGHLGRSTRTPQCGAPMTASRGRESRTLMPWRGSTAAS